jgi:2'-hydroxyisoflavone reductase
VHRRRAGHRVDLGDQLKVLVLGGTVFLGRHLVEAALGRGHEVTLLNRGQTNADLFPEVPRLTGDREGDLSALAGSGWDAVLDPSAFTAGHVGSLATVLGERAGFYALVSTGSVYPLKGPKDEDAPLVDGDDYGGNKARAERAALEWLGPERVLIARSGLIVGPWDPTNRFTYWTVRVAAGGEVLAPGEPGREVQFIHARDEAEWILDLAERGQGGTFNVTGTAATMHRVLEACRHVARSDAAFTWVPDAFLLAHSVGPYMDLPLWIPHALGDLYLPIHRALEAGLRVRPLEQTVAETLAWARSRPAAPVVPERYGLGGGLTPEREAELLALWHAQL